MAWPSKNPFVISEPVTRSGQFLNRTIEMGILEESVSNPAAHIVLLQGARRIGKSSLLRRLKEVSGQRAVCAYLDVRVAGILELPRREATGELLLVLGKKLSKHAGVDLTGFISGDLYRFRHDFLPRLLSAAGQRRVVVLIDETELLQYTSPQSIEDMLDAFQTDAEVGPLMVLSWGRPLGVLPQTELRARLRASRTIDIGLFDEDVTRRSPDHAGVYSFSESARRLLYSITAGHPYYVQALNHVIYERRQSGQNTKTVETDELLKAIQPAHEAIRQGLLHSWADQLSAAQSLLGRALAEIVRPNKKTKDIQLGFTGHTTLAAVAEKLALDGFPQTISDLRVAVEGLEANHVIVRDGEQYGLVAPFLGYWLCNDSYEALLSGSKKRAKPHLEAARQSLEAGDRRGALAECRIALYYDPRDAEACIIAADLQAENGNVDEAVRLLKTAGLSEPQTVKPRLRELLVDRLRAAVAAREDPRTWYFELLEIDPESRRKPAICDMLRDYYLDKWVIELQEGSVHVARDVLDEMAKENFDDWRTQAVSRYVSVQKRSIGSPEKLCRGLVAVRDAFMLITDEPIEEEHRVTASKVLHLLETSVDKEDAVRRLTSLTQAAASSEAWAITIDVLEKGFEYDLDRGDYQIPVSVLRNLAFRAPGVARDLLLNCYRRHLPRRIGGWLRNGSDDALSALRLLVESVANPDIHQILAVLDENALELETSSDDSVVSFFERGASVYRALLDATAPSERPSVTKRIAEQLGFLARRMARRGEDGAVDWSVFIKGWAGIESWNDLLSHSTFAGVPAIEAVRQQLMPPADVMRKETVSQARAASSWAVDLNKKLAESFESAEELPMELPGVSGNLVKTYRATWKGEPVNLKVYRLVSNDPALRRFLMGLWENERRVLFDIATRRQGRALTRLKFAEWRESDDHLIVVTEPVGPLTLRRWLDEGHRPTAFLRQDLWRNINALIEAVAVLHDARHIHRTIRPESVFLGEQGFRSPLKLGNFEWSIYVHSITGRASDSYPRQRTYFDRYSAPEILRGRFEADSGPKGENFGSDIYSLGLVLFEMLVRRLKPVELGFYPGQPYDYAAHREWIESLRDEVRQHVHDTDERLLLLEMLVPDVRARMSELTDAVELSRRFAQDAREVQRLLNDTQNPPRVVTTLFRATPEGIDRFLAPLVDLSEAGTTSEDLSAFVQQLLAGARIYRNGGNPARPIVVEGQVTFTLTPFVHNGVTFSAIPYLTVATAQDRSTGPEIARLPHTIEVENIQTGRARIESEMAETIRKGDVWTLLFEIAANNEDKLEPVQREFHSILRITAEVERSLWDSQVIPYRVVSQTLDDYDHATEVIIESREELGRRKLSVADFVAQQFERQQSSFELGQSSDAIAPFEEQRRWNVSEIGEQRVTLKRAIPGWRVPVNGYLRPDSLRGNRTIYARRQELLRHLEDDIYLLTAVTEPKRLRTDSVERVDRFFNPALDSDKQRIVERVIRTRPIFAVQGPPGTGKTTLAAEVIEQVLSHDPSARILIASQAHEPLNNLLRRVDDALTTRLPIDRQDSLNLRTDAPAIKPIAVRLTTEDKRAKLRDRESSSVVEQFHPSTVAEQYLESARTWYPEGDSRIDEDLLQEWRSLISSEQRTLSVSMESRIVASANLVYVTANDRSIATLSEDQTFDLLIFEEAAKAYPLELLAPMRLARRWLLIGDQDQLPPFDIEAFQEELVPQTRTAFEKQRQLRIGARWGGSRLDYLFLGDDAAQNALKMSDFFEWLHDRGMKEGFGDRLTHQWRMHPDIRETLQATYYKFLVDGDDKWLRKERRHRIVKPDWLRTSTIVWIDVPPVAGEPTRKGSTRSGSSTRHSAGALAAEKRAAGGGYENRYERAVLHELMRDVQIKGYGGFNKDIAFLSPYRGQVFQINKMFDKWDNLQNPHTGSLRNRAFTVDSFQGRQTDVVVVSLVRNNEHREPRAAFGFLQSEQRAGVMFSRAESLLIVIGCSAHFAKGEKSFHINRVFSHIEKHGTVIPASDLLGPRSYDLLAGLSTSGGSRVKRT